MMGLLKVGKVFIALCIKFGQIFFMFCLKLRFFISKLVCLSSP